MKMKVVNVVRKGDSPEGEFKKAAYALGRVLPTLPEVKAVREAIKALPPDKRRSMEKAFFKFLSNSWYTFYLQVQLMKEPSIPGPSSESR